MRQSPLEDDPLNNNRGGRKAPGQSAQPAPQPMPQQMPQQSAPTFSDLQRQGRPRPAPPTIGTPVGVTPMMGGPQMVNAMAQPGPQAPPMPGTVTQGPVGGALQQSVLQFLNQPSRYGSEQAMGTFNRLNTQLQEGFDTRRRQTNANLASRGVYDSTIAAGDLKDLDTSEGRAQVDLAARIAEQQAQTESSDIQRAIQTALGFDTTRFGQEMGNRQQQWQEGVTDTRLNMEQNDNLTRLLMALYGGT